MISPTLKQMRAYLTEMRPDVEGLLIRSVAPEATHMVSMDSFEREQSLQQMLHLSQGQDCHYDRPSIGGGYALWYQAQRVQDAVLALAADFLVPREGDLAILDLGSGTGATWIAADLLERARTSLGGAPRKVSITAVDSSAPMMKSGWRIWQVYCSLVETSVTVTPEVASWAQFIDVGTEPLIVASYLFDASDERRGSEVGRLFAEVLEIQRAQRAVIISAANKTRISETAIRSLIESAPAWNHRQLSEEAIWRGSLPDLGRARVEAYHGVRGDLDRLVAHRTPSWGQHRPTMTRLERASYDSLNLGRVAATFALDGVQDEAATPDNRLTAVIGAAGSGKSRVLVERLMRIVSSEMLKPTRPQTNILLTTYNKEMLGQLGRWIGQAASAFPGVPSPTARGNTALGFGAISFHDRVKVTLLNWDKVPSRLFNVGYASLSSSTPDSWEQIFSNWVARAGHHSQIRRAWLEANSWVTHEFVQAELNRVVYNLDVRSADEYVKVQRIGRGRKLPGDANDRALLWSLMVGDRSESLFIDQRRKMLQLIRAGRSASATFHHVFVDEAQDLLPVEFSDVLTKLVEDAASIVVGLDVTQALHTGSSFTRPSVLAGLNGQRRRWKEHELTGSYRLPISICEALEPLADRILTSRTARRKESDGIPPEHDDHVADEVDPEDLIRPSSRKSAVIGVRPIILAPANHSDLAGLLAEVVNTHRPVVASPGQSVTVTYAESTPNEASVLQVDLASSLRSIGCPTEVSVEPDTMLEIKGLERPLVLWNSKMEVNRIAATDVAEWIYTILTRTTGLLVIALSLRTPPEVQELITSLRRDRLLFWNAAAEHRFDEWQVPARELVG